MCFVILHTGVDSSFYNKIFYFCTCYTLLVLYTAAQHDNTVNMVSSV